MILDNIKTMPQVLKVILILELLAVVAAFFTAYDFVDSSKSEYFFGPVILLIAILPCIFAIYYSLNKNSKAIYAITVSWFTVNLSSVLIAENHEVQSYLLLIISFVFLLGLALFIYMRFRKDFIKYFEA